NAKQRIGPWEPWPRSKTEKETARKLAEALAKLEKRFARLDARVLDQKLERARLDARRVLDRAVHGEQKEFFEWRAQLTYWRERLEIFGGNAQAGRAVSPFHDKSPPWPLRKKGKPQPKSDPRFDFKHDAAVAAAKIVEGHDVDLEIGKKSLFVKVATILANESSIYHQCRVFFKARNRGRK